MFLKKIKSEGIAHLSYILGDGRDAVVIDPRRDCEIYAKIAAQQGMRITRIFETHRNEDYVIGSKDLARRTGAAVYHGKALEFSYGEGVSEGDTFAVGDLGLRILETPGHTFESISIVVTDKNYSKDAVAVFTGDALFIGDVGRTDFFPDQARKVAGALYDSLFGKLLPLGDQTIIYPAHGAGYLLDYGTDIILIPETREQIPAAVAHLIRTGYDRVSGYLKGGMHSWEVEGLPYDRIGAAHAGAIGQRMQNKENLTLLDVRKISEYKQSRLAGATHIFLGELPHRIDELDPDKPVITFCGSGERAIIAASILKRHGFTRVENSLGSMQACKNVGCELQEG